jgi:hypothetical protein
MTDGMKHLGLQPQRVAILLHGRARESPFGRHVRRTGSARAGRGRGQTAKVTPAGMRQRGTRFVGPCGRKTNMQIARSRRPLNASARLASAGSGDECTERLRDSGSADLDRRERRRLAFDVRGELTAADQLGPPPATKPRGGDGQWRGNGGTAYAPEATRSIVWILDYLPPWKGSRREAANRGAALASALYVLAVLLQSPSRI